MTDRGAIAEVFDECAFLLDLLGENQYRARAYSNAARLVQTLPDDWADQLAAGTLKVKGLGEGSLANLRELVSTDKLQTLDDLRAQLTPGVRGLLRLSNFGPKRIKQVRTELGVQSVEELKAACLDGRLAKLKGFGQKSVEKLLQNIAFLETAHDRFLHPVARRAADGLEAHLRFDAAVTDVVITGSVRRGSPTCKDVDLVAATTDPAAAKQAVLSFPGVQRTTAAGDTKVSVVLADGVPADVRLVTPEQFPFALHHFTGSKEHNIRLRQLAKERGWTLSEYGLAPDLVADPPPAVRDEAGLFAALELAFVPPEMREDRGEIEAAQAGTLPVLIERADLRGTFHCHTDASDGQATLEEMVAAAVDLGWEFLGIADHSRSAGYAGGLSVERLREQGAAIDALNSNLRQQGKEFYVFRGVESDVLNDGSLDYPDEVLAELDYVVASVHSNFGMDEAVMTERLIAAVRNPYCTMLGHITGRLLLKRDGYAVDVEAVLKAAAESGCAVEINSDPHRLDLDWTFLKRAKELGVLLVINPDAHSTGGLDNVRYGVMTARKGWVTAADVLNTRDGATVAAFLAARAVRAQQAAETRATVEGVGF